MDASKNETVGAEVAVVDEVAASSVMDVAAIVRGMANGDLGMYSTVKGEDKASKLRVLAAITDSEALADHLREPFDVADYIVQVIQMPNEQTGEVTNQPRIVLLTADGKAYHAISSGVLQSLRNFAGVLGEPSPSNDNWPVSVVCDEVKGRNGFRFMTLKLA